MKNPLTRREFLSTMAVGCVLTAVLPSAAIRPWPRTRTIVTVRGPVPAADLGRILCHEHVLVDFIGAKETGPHRWNRDEVIRVMQPRLMAVKEAGFDTLFECTPAYLGRDPELLVALSTQTGLHIVTNTGYYGARGNLFLPDHAHDASADDLSARWTAEWKKGIAETGVRPGFIKIGLDEGPLSQLHRKLVRAAAKTHRATGLAIASHTGTAPGAFEALDILASEGVAADAFIWVHAQAETNSERHIAAARRGCWISLDGVQDDNAEDYVSKILSLRSAGMLSKVLISQDAGWFSPGEKDGGGPFRSYLSIAGKLLPALRREGLAETEITQLLHDNVVEAFGS